METDKRKHQRYDISKDRRCVLRYLNSADSAGNIQNISRSGVRVTSERPLLRESGKQEQDFVLRASWVERDILVRLKVAWKDFVSERFIYGANFLSINPEDIFELQDALYSDWLQCIPKKR